MSNWSDKIIVVGVGISEDEVAEIKKVIVEKTQKYKIVRMWRDHNDTRVIKRGLTLEQAQAHCKDPKTSVAGVWFDGYEKEN
jgi:hypothetical protein